MTLSDLIEAIGIENFAIELENWMPTDQLEEMIEDIKKDYDLD